MKGLETSGSDVAEAIVLLYGRPKRIPPQATPRRAVGPPAPGVPVLDEPPHAPGTAS